MWAGAEALLVALDVQGRGLCILLQLLAFWVCSFQCDSLLSYMHCSGLCHAFVCCGFENWSNLGRFQSRWGVSESMPSLNVTLPKPSAATTKSITKHMRERWTFNRQNAPILCWGTMNGSITSPTWPLLFWTRQNLWPLVDSEPARRSTHLIGQMSQIVRSTNNKGDSNSILSHKTRKANPSFVIPIPTTAPRWFFTRSSSHFLAFLFFYPLHSAAQNTNNNYIHKKNNTHNNSDHKRKVTR